MNNNKKLDEIYNVSMAYQILYSKINYDELKERFALEPKDLSKGTHVRLMLDGNIVLIDPEQERLWEEVDQAIIDFKKMGIK